MTDFLDDLGATRDQRNRLIESFAKVAYSGPNAALDLSHLVEEVLDVFDPAREGRLLGAPGAAVTARDLVSMIESRARGLLAAKTVPVEQLEMVRILFLNSQARYNEQRPEFESEAYRPADAVAFSQTQSFEVLINNACSNVCGLLGAIVVETANVDA